MDMPADFFARRLASIEKEKAGRLAAIEEERAAQAQVDRLNQQIPPDLGLHREDGPGWALGD